MCRDSKMRSPGQDRTKRHFPKITFPKNQDIIFQIQGENEGENEVSQNQDKSTTIVVTSTF